MWEAVGVIAGIGGLVVAVISLWRAAEANGISRKALRLGESAEREARMARLRFHPLKYGANRYENWMDLEVFNFGAHDAFNVDVTMEFGEVADLARRAASRVGALRVVKSRETDTSNWTVPADVAAIPPPFNVIMVVRFEDGLGVHEMRRTKAIRGEAFPDWEIEPIRVGDGR